MVEQTPHHSPRQVKKVQFTKEPILERTISPDSAQQGDTVLSQLGRSVIQGVEIIDIKQGTGLTARNGWRVYIHLVGKLPDGTIFDDSTGFEPFTFILGAGEVIKGLEVGIEGMRVGGERWLNIPPAMCYGDDNYLSGMPEDTNWEYNSMILPLKYSLKWPLLILLPNSANS